MESEAPAFSDMTVNVERVQELLQERRWTSAMLAAAMGMNKSTVSRVMGGRAQPGARFVLRIQALFPNEANLFVPVAPELAPELAGELAEVGADPVA